MNAIDRTQFAELLGATRIKPRIKRELRFVPEEITDWADRDFIAITNRSRSEGVLVVPFETTRVISFESHARQANNTGRVEAIICDICATWQRGSNSAVISFQKERSTISFLCCADLNCSLHVRNKTPQASLSRTQLRESSTESDRINRLQQRLRDIVSRV